MAKKTTYEITNYGQTRVLPFREGGLRLTRRKCQVTDDPEVARIALTLPLVEVIDQATRKRITALPKVRKKKSRKGRPKRKARIIGAGSPGERSRAGAKAR